MLNFYMSRSTINMPRLLKGSAQFVFTGLLTTCTVNSVSIQNRTDRKKLNKTKALKVA